MKFYLLILAMLCSDVALVPGPAALAGDAEPHTIVNWRFDAESSQRLQPHGDLQRDQAGPRPPAFPDFPSNNTAVRLGDNVGYLAFADPGTNSDFDFNNGDEITIEAWIKLTPDIHGSPIYIVGKGRTGNPRFIKDNQNWALRLQKFDDQVRLSFLFATEPSSNGSHWHRWTSTQAFPVFPAWHHVAISYRFGSPESIRGWIDGQASGGTWDMGGPTADPPIVDDDEIWIGSANHGNRFVGLVDEVAIHRGRLSDEELASRYNRVGEVPKPEFAVAIMPELGVIPEGRVLVTLGENLPAENRWFLEHESWPVDLVRWTTDAFLLHRLPIAYEDWGIRDAWEEPVLVRMAADVQLEAGSHRLLMRARGIGRLWLDGELIAVTHPVTRKSPDGEQPITPVAVPPTPGSRPHGYHQQEVFGEAIVPASKSDAQVARRVVLELIVGGKGQRTEPGEVCVAVESADGRSFNLLTAASAAPIPLTDASVEPLLKRIEQDLSAFDDANRRSSASSQDTYWNRRHEAARKWAEEHPAETISVDSQNLTPVDAWIYQKLMRAKQAADLSDRETTDQFYAYVLPILSEHCVRCHGDKEKGGLKLDARDAALLAGESELPAIVPGKPEASELISQVRSGAMPPTGAGLSEQQISILESWILDGAPWPAPKVTQVSDVPLVRDEVFLRRVFLDTVGVPPTLTQARNFLQDDSPGKRSKLIEQLLRDERLADHWVSYWQDLLAENPTLLNQSMASTGPFRWFLYESLRDNKPLDRMVTELIMMRGSPDTGGSAGFGLSGESDAPLAEKAHIIAAAFLGVELRCARCHDSPYHQTTQQDLYSLAAMLQREAVRVPPTSRVPDAFFEAKGRESLIRVTLKPDQQIAPQWPLKNIVGLSDADDFDKWLQNPNDTRERLALLVTSPQNRRFGRVMVNRVWKRLMGAGLVEPIQDWEGASASHPQLLDWLVRELITNDYDLRVVMKQIMNSDAYQRIPAGNNLVADPPQRFFLMPDRRRLSAEQIVDSLYVVTGARMETEELTFVHDGQRSIGKRQSLGFPKRAWMMASLNNERDRPSLSLPRARIITDVLQAFGWNGSRQKPIHVRDTDPNVLQPGVLLNGTLVMTLTRAHLDSDLSRHAIEAASIESLVEDWFLRILCRQPTTEEKETFVNELVEGFQQRLLPVNQIRYPDPPPPLPKVTWFNHLQSETSTIQRELERRVNAGPPPDPRIEPAWRAVYEDFIWSLINHRDFVWVP